MILDGCEPVATLPAAQRILEVPTIIKHLVALPGRGSAGRGRPSAGRKADLAAPTPRAEP
jgi:hypothetical protein